VVQSRDGSRIAHIVVPLCGQPVRIADTATIWRVPRALITGVTGQDGSYLAELLLARGYDVHGLVRRSSVMNRTRIDHLQGRDRWHLHYGDLTDAGSLLRLVRETRPDEVYHLGAMSHVGVSFEMPEFTMATNAGGTERLLRAVLEVDPGIRFYQASSAEIFARGGSACHEASPTGPSTPYGGSKLAAHRATVAAREVDGLFAVCGIAFNHESPRRGENFVTRKITRAVAAIARGVQDSVTLGSLDAVRDWGYAPEYVEAMWQMLQHDEPVDLVLATGVGHSVQDFVAAAFEHAGLDWRRHVRFDEGLTRPVGDDAFVGDPGRAGDTIGWKAQTTALDVAALMVESDLHALDR
jgi:GDPmannose 4,6-dehydratase